MSFNYMKCYCFCDCKNTKERNSRYKFLVLKWVSGGTEEKKTFVSSQSGTITVSFITLTLSFYKRFPQLFSCIILFKKVFKKFQLLKHWSLYGVTNEPNKCRVLKVIHFLLSCYQTHEGSKSVKVKKQQRRLLI